MLSGSNMYFFPFKDRLNRELEMQNEVTIEEEEGEMENKIESNTFGTQVQSTKVQQCCMTEVNIFHQVHFA